MLRFDVACSIGSKSSPMQTSIVIFDNSMSSIHHKVGIKSDNASVLNKLSIVVHAHWTRVSYRLPRYIGGYPITPYVDELWELYVTACMCIKEVTRF